MPWEGFKLTFDGSVQRVQGEDVVERTCTTIWTQAWFLDQLSYAFTL